MCWALQRRNRPETVYDIRRCFNVTDARPHTIKITGWSKKRIPSFLG